MSDRIDDTDLPAAAARLGAEAAERVDVEAVAEAVVRRLREPATRWARWPARAWRVAAAVVLLAGGALVLRHDDGAAPAGGVLPVTIELADLPASDLERLLGSLDEVWQADSVPQVNGDLDDLTVDQLQLVLRSLEG